MLILSDPHERLPRPDLSNLPRFRVLTTVDFPPFSFMDQTGRLAGFNIDLVRAICDELQISVRCQIQAVPFGDIEAALEAGQAEASAAGIAVTSELRERFAFSRPYLTLPARFARNRKFELAGPAAMALSGRPVGVVASTAHDRMLESFFPQVKRVTFESREKMLQALISGEVEAVFSDGLSLPFWVASAASQGCCVLFDGPYVSEHFLGEGIALMLPQAPQQLSVAVDYALAQLAQKGRLQEMYLRYFPNGFY